MPSEPLNSSNLKEFDFIQHYYGQTNQTHAWSEFRLKPQVVERLTKARVSRPLAA
jgi:hypothetical protein